MKAARLALGALIVAGLAPGQSLKNRQERFFTASCQAVWQHAVSAFGEKGFEYSRGTITRNVRRYLQAWTYSKGSFLNEALRVDGATLMLTNEPIGCQVKAKINFASRS